MKDPYKVVDKVEQAIDASFDLGYKRGRKEGLREGREAGFNEGVEAHKAHIQARLKASEELALSVGKGADAVRMREMAEFLAFEYDPVAAEAEYAQRDKDWAY